MAANSEKKEFKVSLRRGNVVEREALIYPVEFVNEEATDNKKPEEREELVEKTEDKRDLFKPIEFLTQVEVEAELLKLNVEESLTNHTEIEKQDSIMLEAASNKELEDENGFFRPVYFLIKDEVVIPQCCGDENSEMVEPVQFFEKFDSSIEDKTSSNDDQSTFRSNLKNEFKAEEQKLMKASFSNPTDNLIELTISEELLYRYRFQEGLLYFIDKTELKPICNFQIFVLKKIKRFDGVYTDVTYLVKGILAGGKELEVVFITPSDFQSSDWIYRRWGIECVLFAGLNSYSYVKEYISHQAKGVPEEMKYDFIGWHYISNRYIYLHGGGAIGGDNLQITGDKSKYLRTNLDLSPKDTYRHLLESLNIGNPEITLPIFAYNLLSLMTTMFKEAGKEPKFVLWLHGITGSRKTTLAKYFCNIFGSSSENIPATFKDTRSALDVKTFEFKDSTLIVDDYHPASDPTERAEMNLIAQHIIRLYGDRIGKNRMTRTMTKQKTYIPRGLCIVTGEDSIQGHSTNSRIVPIEIQRDDVNLERLTYFQNNRVVYTTGLYYFIEYLARHYSEIRKFIGDNFDLERGKVLNQYGHGRLAESFVFFQFGYKIFLEYGFHMGAISTDEFLIRYNFALEIFRNGIKKHESQMFMHNPDVMYLVALNELIQSNKLKILDVDSNLTSSNVIGYFDAENFYFFSKLAYAAVKQFWRDQGKMFSLGESATIKALDRNGILVTSVEGGVKRRTLRNSSIKTLSGGRPRFLTINKKMMAEALKNI